MSEAIVCILAIGDPAYFKAARVAAQSVLKFSDFDVFFAHGPSPAMNALAHPRVHTFYLDHAAAKERSAPFLAKFRALQACLDYGNYPFIIALDADAVLVRSLTCSFLESSMNGRALALVEQPCILGSPMTRMHLRSHYIQHTLAWFENTLPAPPMEVFRFYNSGVVLAHRDGMRDFLAWAQTQFATAKRAHRIGQHMIADQDYFQYWTNSLNPGICTTLPWHWNHCEHWDDPFPRPNARILHFSNFCLKPTRLQLAEMSFFCRRGIKENDPFIRIFAVGRKLLHKYAARVGV